MLPPRSSIKRPGATRGAQREDTIEEGVKVADSYKL